MRENEKEHHPVLLSEERGAQKMPTPYLLIAFILFAVLGAFWKIAMYDKGAAKAQYAEKKAAIEADIRRFRVGQ